MLKVRGYKVIINATHGGYIIQPLPWKTVVFPKTFGTEAAAMKAVETLELAIQGGQDFIPVVCDDNKVRLYYIPSNFCPKQFLFKELAFINEFPSISKAIEYFRTHKDLMVF